MTQSEDDLDLSVRRSRRRRSKRISMEQAIPVKRSRRSDVNILLIHSYTYPY